MPPRRDWLSRRRQNNDGDGSAGAPLQTFELIRAVDIDDSPESRVIPVVWKYGSRHDADAIGSDVDLRVRSGPHVVKPRRGFGRATKRRDHEIIVSIPSVDKGGRAGLTRLGAPGTQQQTWRHSWQQTVPKSTPGQQIDVVMHAQHRKEEDPFGPTEMVDVHTHDVRALQSRRSEWDLQSRPGLPVATGFDDFADRSTPRG